MRNKAIIILMFTLFIMFSSLTYSAIPQAERNALISLYNSTNGDSWTDNSGWKTPPLHTDGFAMPGTEKKWYGITVSGKYVTEIKLFDNSLTGSIPTDLGNLPSLTYVDLNHNQLTGSIPSELDNLSVLTYLNLHSNQLTGSIPQELGSLSNLEYLYLDSNQLTGSIPQELGNLSNLTRLYLHHNQLSGSIPSTIGNLTRLKKLYLNDNQLSGDIPSQLRNLSALTTLDLHSNQLAESIPQELGGLSALTSLDLHNNQLAGSIPQELGSLSNLIQLYLHSNRLENEIPPQLGNLLKLQYLYLNGNRLKGDIPSDIASLTNLLDNQSDFRWNALYTDNESLRDFLNSKQDGGDWESTQTIAPGDVKADVINSTSINVSWTPIIYTDDPGVYLVFYSTTSGEPYTWCGTTIDKTVSQMEVTDLSKNTTYYFVVKTQTDPHSNNQNTVESDYSEPASETTPEDITISGRVYISTETGIEGLSGVTMIFYSDNGGTKAVITTAEGYYNHTVNSGWSGRVTPSKNGYEFEPVGHTGEYENVTSDMLDQDYTAKAILPIISGRVANKKGIGIPGVTMTFSNGGESTSTTTDSNGNYNLGVKRGWTGTVTPFKTTYTFSPINQSYENVNADLSGQDYTATESLPVISGGVTISTSSVGISVVTLTFSDDGGTAITDIKGNYSHAVNYGWTGTVTPSKTGYSFAPSHKYYSEVKEDKTQNYKATAEWPIISGRVVAKLEGTGISGVTLTFSNGGEITSTTTDSDGIYRHGVPPGWYGTVTPSKTEYEFEPANRSYNNVKSNQSNQDYTATTNLPVISGRVTHSTNTGISGLSGVTMTFSSESGGFEIETTNTDGYYYHAVRGGWLGTVTPEKEGFTFSPTHTEYSDVVTDQTQDYTATPIIPVISGRVFDSEEKGIANVTMKFSHEVESTNTDSYGNYSQEVPYKWSGTVEPQKAGFTFSPTQAEYSNVDTDRTQNYTASTIFPVISGRVYDKDDNGIEGVTMNFSNGVESVVTDSKGNYSQQVPYKWSGTVEPEKKGFEFTPESKYYSNVTSNQSWNCIAIRIPYKISGRVTNAAGEGVEGVTMTFSNGVESVDTDFEGTYSQHVPYEWSGTVTPSKGDLLFNPHHKNFLPVTKNESQDFKLSVTLILTASRHEESSLIIKKEYGKINVNAVLIGTPLPNVQKYIIYRKKFGGSYEKRKEFTVQEYDRGEAFPYEDKYLETGVPYIYKAEARDANDKVIGVSNEKAI